MHILIENFDTTVLEYDRGIADYRYLLDGLNNIGSESVNMELVDGNTPCILRSGDPVKQDGKKKDYLYIIMPLRTEE